MNLILASASPRRRELLGHLGVPFEVVPADLDESLHPGEHAAAYVERLARAKAAGEGLRLAADTSVVIDDEVLGKPGHDAALGATMLRRLAGRAHQVMTGIAVSSPQGIVSRVVISEVHFRKLSEAEIAWYVSTGEGADKAGGYALQGRAGTFITSVVGSPSNVIGLPLADTVELLRAAGLRLPMDGA
ncbi:MAG: nucleoside triphosphate pyrophosphatase [Archangium sp.]|nr:nucleoside triphosphate pyrophosphatase [Archangium sp.]MDP3155682.1 nucleoside triphosphate pyrophosphatase [Archangium sp.]MDP3569769.1 nucleoside triphosphate pyrophosphatase [Archangium sp.]